MAFRFKLTGMTPLLMCADDIELSDMIKEWQKNPANKNKSVPGDDRSPPWTWKTRIYSDGEHVVLPSDNVMAILRKAGADVHLKGQKTMKSATQSDLFIPRDLVLLADGKRVKSSDIEAIDGTFKEQCDQVKPLGFVLFMKRAKVGQSKHVRVRPRFDKWETEWTEIQIIGDNPDIDGSVLEIILKLCGRIGACDWRPSAPKSPGPFGQFRAEVEEVK